MSTPAAAVVAVVAVVAFLTRWALMAEAGLQGLHGYDDGVHYAGAAALLSGRLPYGDFLFLHPPGILVALAPFAGLGRLTSDPLGLSAARVAFWALGALNAALVARLAGRYGLVPAAVAGLLYALWFPARYAERTATLEPAGNTALLVALLLLTRPEPPASRRDQVLAGAALGVAVGFKIWMVVPAAVLVAWQLISAGWRPALRVATGVGASALVLVAPFVGVGRDMFRMVVLDQLGRPRDDVALLDRLAGVVGLAPLSAQAPPAVTHVAVLGTTVLLVLAAAAALRRPPGRLLVALLGATVVVLLASPSYIEHYSTYAAVPVVLVLATAAGVALPVRRPAAAGRPVAAAPPRWRPVVTGLAVAALAGLFGLQFALTVAVDSGRPFPGARLRTYVADRPCVVSNDPAVLALLDVLSRDLRRDCPLLIDATGLTYDRYARTYPDGRPVPRPENGAWQERVQRHLTSGSATVLGPSNLEDLSEATRRRLATLPVLGRAGPYEVLGRPPSPGAADGG
ncbi:MAG: glycosyltransferase 87 family protein [Actinomycetota bacterium]|nr:glycosyltransferase 87 family protein [Actinomycetota bacterium]